MDIVCGNIKTVTPPYYAPAPTPPYTSGCQGAAGRRHRNRQTYHVPRGDVANYYITKKGQIPFHLLTPTEAAIWLPRDGEAEESRSPLGSSRPLRGIALCSSWLGSLFSSLVFPSFLLFLLFFFVGSSLGISSSSSSSVAEILLIFAVDFFSLLFTLVFFFFLFPKEPFFSSSSLFSFTVDFFLFLLAVDFFVVFLLDGDLF